MTSPECTPITEIVPDARFAITTASFPPRAGSPASARAETARGEKARLVETTRTTRVNESSFLIAISFPCCAQGSECFGPSVWAVRSARPGWREHLSFSGLVRRSLGVADVDLHIRRPFRDPAWWRVLSLGPLTPFTGVASSYPSTNVSPGYTCRIAETLPEYYGFINSSGWTLASTNGAGPRDDHSIPHQRSTPIAFQRGLSTMST